MDIANKALSGVSLFGLLVLLNGCISSALAPESVGLMRAAGWGNTKMVRVLLGKGADVDEKDPESGFTALMAASLMGHTEIVRLLIDRKADVNARDTQGHTALSIAIEKGHAETIKLLVDAGAAIDAKDPDGVQH